MKSRLRVLAWDHPRAVLPLEAAGRAWTIATGGSIEILRRSLESFGDDVPSADRADLVLIDHPHIGGAVAAGAILPLDERITPDTLGDLISGAVGPSGDCYSYSGSTWAVPVDAACQAMACGHSIVPPTSVTDLLELAGSTNIRVAIPLHPAHAISTYISLAAGFGCASVEEAFGENDAALSALVALSTLAACGPSEAFAWEPPHALAAVERGAIDCVPFVYCYVGYDVAWSDVPVDGGPPRPVLGGVGMALLAACDTPDEAVAFAAWYGSRSVQREIVLACGGQPATSDAWDVALDPMYRAVRSGMHNATVRPRDPWWPAFQNDAGVILRDGLLHRTEPGLLCKQLSARCSRRERVG